MLILFAGATENSLAIHFLAIHYASRLSRPHPPPLPLVGILRVSGLFALAYRYSVAAKILKTRWLCTKYLF